MGGGNKKKRPKMEYRYYEIPAGSPVLALLGEKWVQNYGRDIDYLHFHNHMEIGFCYDGEGCMTMKDEDVPFGGQMFSVIPRNYPHTTNSTPGTVSRWEYLFIDADGFLKDVFSKNNLMADSLIRRVNRKAHFFRVSQQPQMAEKIRQIIEVLRARKEFYQEEVNGLLLGLLVEIARLNREDQLDGREEEQADSMLISRALDFISDCYDHPLRVEQMAEVCHISETHFRRIFIQCMHMTPVEYLNRVRVKMACDMLRTTNDQVGVIAARVGFSTLSTFNRNFKQIMGKTPQKWRRDPDNFERKLLNYDIKTEEGW